MKRPQAPQALPVNLTIWQDLWSLTRPLRYVPRDSENCQVRLAAAQALHVDVQSVVLEK